MQRGSVWRRGMLAVFVALSLSPAPLAAQDESEALVPLVVDLLREKDKDLRALGLEQVRTEAKGEAATKAFAAELPKLPPETQAALLRALADRGDAAARPAVLEQLAAGDEAVRVAAIESLTLLGQADDVPQMVPFLGKSAAEQAAARNALSRLAGDGVSGQVAAALKGPDAAQRVALIEILAARRAASEVEALAPLATDIDAKVRAAAVAALTQLAGPPQVGGLVQAFLAAPAGAERDALERAIAQASLRGEGDKAAPLLAARAALPVSEQTILLPVLGRVGGAQTLALVEAAIADPKLREVGLKALCNWPDASVAPRLVELIALEKNPQQRILLLRALIRVAPLPDDRPLAEKLALMQTALDLCTRDEDKNYVLQRARAIRIPETLKFLRPFLDQPAHREVAAESIVELAHHRTLREAAKPEFMAALDQIIAVSKDPTSVERATRYKNNQTWVRPK